MLALVCIYSDHSTQCRVYISSLVFLLYKGDNSIFDHCLLLIDIKQSRHSPEQRRERRYRQRSPDGARESDRGARRIHMDRDENREGRRQRIRERLGPRTRKGDDGEESDDKDDHGTRWKQRNERFCK